MKKFILAVAAFSMMFCAVSFAQEGNREDWRERVRAEKKAFLKDALGIEDGDAFWAVYDAVQAESASLMKARMEASRALRKALKENKSESEIAPLLKAFMDADAACIDFKKSSRERYAKVLPADKMARLIFAEERFMGRQMDRRGGHGQGRGNGRPGGHSAAPGHGHGPGPGHAHVPGHGYGHGRGHGGHGGFNRGGASVSAE